MDDEILGINSLPLPYKLDAKIFHNFDEDGNIIGEPFSYNDMIKEIENISGVNIDLLGKSDEYKIALGKHDFPTSIKSTQYPE